MSGNNSSQRPQDPQAALQQQLLLHALAVASGTYPQSAPPPFQQYPVGSSSNHAGPAYPVPTALPPLIDRNGSYSPWGSSQQQPFHPFMFGLPPQAQAAQPSTSSEASASTSHSPQNAGPPVDVGDEKRRRNTEASARFRVKKKLKTVHLQRGIDDLTGRADDLEREAAELRRENSWLKEIVMLKGGHISPEDLHTSNQPPRRLTNALWSMAAELPRPTSQPEESREGADEEGDEQADSPGSSKRKIDRAS
ncbi:hypothetical protein BDV98DRAFT_559205 [Pterulicium gracile]|uniref:BZIP domain-containing protein n=1 Tax=Pterulicium gracile TaxID=1884261 RepID=A0A5C3QWB1_9AGAR|nr:hypothetical protein BDV98DRAFT_559205 [Pterula gracilis]